MSAMLKVDRRPDVAPPAVTGTARLPAVALAVCLVVSVVVFSDVWRSMVVKWYESETFTHGFLIAPISAWMIWHRRALLTGARQAPSWLGLALLALAGAGWIVGELAGVNAVRQLAVVGMIPATIWALCGWDVVRRIAFPLAFLFFLVPIGDFLMPIMMQHTADATVLALRASGIPVYREGLNFQIPSGSWSVVEACSGLRYVIASAVLGTVFAYLHYTSLRRRVAFIVASILVPVIANWMRAYIIVMIGHLSSMQLATGVDHLVYGWAFFGLVMAALFWLGMRWQEPQPASGASVPSGGAGRIATPGTAGRTIGRPGVAVAALGVVVVLALLRGAPPMLLDVAPSPDFARTLQSRLPTLRQQPLTLLPHYTGERARVAGVFGDDPRAEAFVAYYARQADGHEMVSSDNRLIALDDPTWRIARSGRRAADGLPVHETELYSGPHRLLVWQWYAIGGRSVADDYRAKLVTVLAALTGRGDHSAVAVLTTPADDGIEAARARLAARAATLQPALADLTVPRGH